MNSYLRNSSIVRIMAAMDATAPRFEEFGGKFMNYLLTVPLNHRGLNVLGHSVGYTVDSYDDKATVVGQYSAEKRYFDGLAEKPVDDILHSLRMKPTTTDIFLIALELCEPLEEERIRTRLINSPGFVGRTIHFYNRRRIAEYMVDYLLVSDSAVETLGQYLPILPEISAEHSSNLLVPKTTQGYQERQEVERVVRERLNNEKCLFLTGAGGLGKSQIAAAYAQAEAANFEVVIWADGSRIKDVNDLHALEMGRAGVKRNVVSLLGTRRCLLIIDDLATKVDSAELAALCGDDARVLVTQRERVPEEYEIPFMDEALARLVLTRGIQTELPKQVWQQIWTTVGGHPLSLSLMNAAANDGTSWEDLEDDCERVGEFEDTRYQRLTDRLLRRFEQSLSQELSVFRWLGSKEAYRPLLRALIGAVGIRKHISHSLIAPSRQSVVRLHDVIHAALESANWIPGEAGSLFTDDVEQFLITAANSPTIDLRAAATVMRSKLLALVQAGQRRPAFIYALLLDWSPEELDRAIVDDPEHTLKGLETSGRPVSPIETALVFETIECIYRSDKATKPFNEALEGLRNRIDLYERIAALPGLNTLQTTEIVHHKGKSLALVGQLEEANVCFETVLKGPHPLYESRLQLVKVFNRLKRRPEAIAQAVEVMNAAAADPHAVSNSVTLATICAVPSGPERDKFMETYADVAEREILIAGDVGLAQAFESFVAVSRSWRYRDPERFKRVWSALELPTPTDDGQRFVLAELFQNASYAHPDQKTALMDRALTLYSEIKNLTDFQRQQYANALVEATKYGDALNILSQIEKPTPWSHYYRSIALLNTNEARDALTSIELAITELPEKSSNFRSSFLAHRFDVRMALGEPGAIDDLHQAIAQCTSDQYREELLHRLECVQRAATPANGVH